MASSVKVMAVVLGAEASSVEPLPCILGDDSSESEGDVVGAGSASILRGLLCEGPMSGHL